MTTTLYRSGSIYAPGTPRATALLVESGADGADVEAGATSKAIIWAGTDEAAARLGAADVVVDLQGGLLAPAFVDAWVDAAHSTSSVRAAAGLGVGAVHLLRSNGSVSERERGGWSSGPEVVTYSGVLSGDLDLDTLRHRYRDDTTAGRQTVVVLDDADDLALVLIAAAAAADESGIARFVGARHRLHSRSGVPGSVLAELARLGFIVCLAPISGPAGSRPAASGSAAPGAAGWLSLRELAGAGVPLAFGSAAAGPARSLWEVVRTASSAELGDSAISVRAAFAAATRGGRRAAAQDASGEIRPGATATFAIWDYEGALVVRTPDARVAAWSTDPRAATPGLPDLSDGAPVPHCRRTVVGGRIVFDDGSIG
ncbi:MAG TPA: amidohydrolase family protein [Frankiaceae bacterium]|nr:amidohydrolase family protein [Frankiaceae bacterium]